MKGLKAYYQEDPFSAIVLTAAVLIGIFYLLKYIFVDRANETDDDIVDPAVPERRPRYFVPPTFNAMPSSTGSVGRNAVGLGGVGGVATGSAGGARVSGGGGKGGAI